MKALVLGAAGILGFAIHRTLTDYGVPTVGSVRGTAPRLSLKTPPLQYIEALDISDLREVAHALDSIQPSVVINTIVQKEDGDLSPARLIRVNSVFPKQLERLTEARGIHLIHFSTDSVYGDVGAPFRESDIPLPTDIYAMSKYAGELVGSRSLTLRLSLIGFGLKKNNGLLDWFFSQTGLIKGYSEVMFSGLPANEVAKVVATYILPKMSEIRGIYNLSGPPISKMNLLLLIKEIWNLAGVEIVSDDRLKADRTLCSEKMWQQIKYSSPEWPVLVREMKHFYEINLSA